MAIMSIASAQEKINFSEFIVADDCLVSELAIQHYAEIYKLSSKADKSVIVNMYCDILDQNNTWREIIAATKGLWLIRGFSPTPAQLRKINLIPLSVYFKTGNLERYYREISEMIFLAAYLKIE